MNNGIIHEQPVRYRVSMYRKDSYRARLMIQQGERPSTFDPSGEFIEIDIMAVSQDEAVKKARKIRPAFEVYVDPRVIYGGLTIVFDEYEF